MVQGAIFGFYLVMTVVVVPVVTVCKVCKALREEYGTMEE